MIRVDTLCEGAITRFIVDGTPVASDIIAAIEKHYHTIKDAAMWIFSDADISKATDHEMRMIATSASQHSCHKKTAYVGNDDLPFGLIRMYQAYLEFHNIRTISKSFRSESDAIKWLLEESS